MKKNSLIDNIKDIVIIIGRAIKNAFVRAFFGTKKELSLLEEEAVQSPLRVSARKFFKKKLGIIGLIIFGFVFSFCFVGSLFVDLNLVVESGQSNISPGFQMMNVPTKLKQNGILEIAVSSRYSMGIDKQNNVYLWGQDLHRIVSDFQSDVDDAQKGLKVVDGIKAKRVWAGRDHFVLELVDGSLVSFATVPDILGFRLATIPTALLVGGQVVNVEQAIKDDGGVLDVVAENQVTLVITNKNRVFMWGNNNKIFNVTRQLVDRDPIAAGYSRRNLTFLFENGEVAVIGSGVVATNIPNITNGKQLVTTAGSAVVLTDDGYIVAWGDNLSGELNFDQKIQGRVVRLAKSAVGTDGNQSLSAILDDGTVYKWGSNKNGTSDVPTNLTSGKIEVSNVFSGYYQNYAIDANGKLISTWGLKGHLFGTDSDGFDIFSRVIHGGKISLTIGLVAVVISTVIGIIIGGISGFYGGQVDIILMRVSEIVSAIPFLPLAMTLSAIVTTMRTQGGEVFSNRERMVMIMIILGVLSWPGLARLIRATILSEREKEFVTAAKALGVKTRNIIFRHIIPNVITIIIISATLGYAGSILTESGLSFLGFGVQTPEPSWGNMLSGAQDMTVIRQHWWRWVFPSIFLCLATISINLIGDSIRDAVDPRSREK